MNCLKQKISIFVLVILYFLPMGIYSENLDINNSQPLYKHKFIYDGRNNSFDPLTISIVGDFNNFSSKANPMVQTRPKIFETTIEIPEGEYSYHFRAVNAEGKIKQFVDPKQPQNNGQNSIYIGPKSHSTTNLNYFGSFDERKLRENLQLLHDPNNSKFFSFAQPNLTRIICRITANTAPSVVIYYRLVGQEDQKWKTNRMNKTETQNEWDYFTITINEFSKGVLEYFFHFSDNMTSYILANDIFTKKIEEGYEYPFRVTLPKVLANQWAIDSIWYEIMIDRFRNGDASNDTIDVRPWNEWPTGAKLEFINFLYGWSRDSHIQSPIKSWVQKRHYDLTQKYTSMMNELSFGGDLQGIEEKLSYLKELGVNSLYLTPIFKGHGVHRYHTIDIRHVDDAFGVKGSYNLLKGETDDPKTWQWSGSDLLFLKLLETLHAQGFKVVLDLNLHSVYKKSPLFLDVLKNKTESPYYDWFEIYDFGDTEGHQPKYKSMDEIYKKNEMPSFAATPELNYPESLKNYLFASILRWLSPNGDSSKGVDGFRIDSPKFLPIRFALELRDFIQSHKPEAILIGENWESSDTWNQLNIYDGIQDVEWTKNLYYTFVGNNKSIYNYTDYLFRLFRSGSITNVLNSWHSIDNHDTMRFLSMLTNPTANFRPELLDYQVLNNPTALDYERLYQVIALQFTCFGCPLIYYGDEVGMVGNGDPFNRAPMWWADKQELPSKSQKIFSYYKNIIALRNHLTPLRRGDFNLIPLDEVEGIFGISRNIGDDYVYVIFNRSTEVKFFEITVKGHKNDIYIDYLNPSHATIDTRKDIPISLSDDAGYIPNEGQLSLAVQPWKTMIIRKKLNPSLKNRIE